MFPARPCSLSRSRLPRARSSAATATSPPTGRISCARLFLGTARRDRTEPDVRWIREQHDQCGSIDPAVRTAMDLADAAKREADAVLADAPAGPDRDFLLALPQYVVSRQR